MPAEQLAVSGLLAGVLRDLEQHIALREAFRKLMGAKK